MDAKKLGIGAAVVGAGALAFHSSGPRQMREHCRSMCAAKCGDAAESDEPQEPAERGCCGPATPRDTVVA